MSNTSTSPFHQHQGAESAIGAHLNAVSVSYSVVDADRKVKRVLKDISFSVACGEMCALMGPSGAGKSTLLDLLAARKLDGVWSGDILIDGRRPSRQFGRETAYVLQDQVLIPTLTVEETIRYAARTKLPEGTTSVEIQRRTDLLLEMMALTHIKDSRVGDGMTKGISGGQAKRLSIAVEIVHLPRLLFLDEPTSGLDSSIAFEVMATLRSVVTQSRTCLCTIHQPSREIFALFDTLVLLANGRVIYYGPVVDVVTHFTQPEVGYQPSVEHPNAAEFVLEISCGQRLPAGWRVPRQPDELEKLYRTNRFFRSIQTVCALSKAESHDDHGSDPGGLQRGDTDSYPTTMWTQLSMLLERTWVAKARDTDDLRAQTVKSLALAIILGLVFYDAGDISGPFYRDGKLTSEANSVNSFLFFFAILTMFKSVHAVPYMCARTVLYRRELASSAYSPFPYWLSSILVITPWHFVFHLLLACIAYGMVGLNSNAGVFFYFVFATYAGNFVSTLMAMAMGACIPNIPLALTLYPAQFLFLTMFVGYAIRLDDIPVYWRWAPYVTCPRWVFQGLMVNEWSQYDTDDDGGQGGSDGTGDGDVLEDFGFDGFNKLDTFWICLLFAMGFAAIMYYGLLPPRNRLKRVSDATNVTAVLQSYESSRRTTWSPWGVGGQAKTNAAGAKQRRAADPTLKESLVESGGPGAEEHLVAEEAPLVFSPPFTVESYHLSAGVVERAQGCHLVFSDIHYTVTDPINRTKALILLKGVGGRAMPGEMVALMGGSGAGKTTLLDVLAQRKTTGTSSGTITYNGSAEMIPSAYVMQDNVHMGILTVRESLHYAAELRLSERASAQSKARRVQKIIDMLGLQGVADAVLGTESIRGVSGGELKRVSIGVEIVHLPDLMFLDEPTTGLDSSISLEVMSAVRNLANQNRTIVCTIHQPSEDTFALFDSLLLLAAGRVIYFGPASSAVSYFTQSPYGFICKAGANPADFIIAVTGGFIAAADVRVVSSGELSTYFVSTDYAGRVGVFERARAESGQKLVTGGPSGVIPSLASQDSIATAYVEPQGNSLRHQLQVLLHRRLLVIRKDPVPIIRPWFRDLLVGLFYGSIYFQLDSGDDCDETCYTDRVSLLFFGLQLVVMSQLVSASNLQIERPVFYRERGAKVYRTLAYCVTSVAPQLVICIMNVLCYSLGAYTLTGLRSGAGYFGVFFIIMLLTSYCGLFMALAVSAVARTTEVALSWFTTAFAFCIFYAGYVVYIPSMDKWQGKWLPYLSFYRYAFQGLVLNEFQHNSELPDYQHYINQLGFNVISVQGCAAVLLLFIGLGAAAYYAALKYVSFEER